MFAVCDSFGCLLDVCQFTRIDRADDAQKQLTILNAASHQVPGKRLKSLMIDDYQSAFGQQISLHI